MHDVALLQKAQRKKELLGIYPDSPNVQPNVLAKTLDDISEVHTAAIIRTLVEDRVQWGITSKIRRQDTGARGVQRFALAGRRVFCRLDRPA